MVYLSAELPIQILTGSGKEELNSLIEAKMAKYDYAFYFVTESKHLEVLVTCRCDIRFVYKQLHVNPDRLLR